MRLRQSAGDSFISRMQWPRHLYEDGLIPRFDTCSAESFLRESAAIRGRTSSPLSLHSAGGSSCVACWLPWRCHLAVSPVPAADTRKPNVIVFLADDVGWGELGFSE